MTTLLRGCAGFIWPSMSPQNRSMIDISLYRPLSTLQFSAPGSVAQSHIMEWAGWAFLWMMITPDDLSASHNMSLTAICSKCSSSMSRVCTCTLVRARIIWNSICGARTSFLIQSSSLTGGEAIYALYILNVSTLFTVESGQNLVYTVHSPVRPCTILCTVLSVQNIVFFVHSALPCTALHSLVHSAVYCTVLNTLLP